MSDFALPSGRVIRFIKERPSWGDVEDAILAGEAGAAETPPRRFAVSEFYVERLTGLTRAQLRELEEEDADALFAEIRRRRQPRAKEDPEREAPFGTPSSPSSGPESATTT